MSALEETYQKKAQHATERSWFIVYSVAFVFGIIWTALGEGEMKIVFVTLTFILFLNAMIKMEMSARALEEH